MTWKIISTDNHGTLLKNSIDPTEKVDTETKNRLVVAQDQNLNNPNFLLRTYSDTDPELITIIKKRYLIPPSPPESEYVFPARMAPDSGQVENILEIFKHKRNGYFIECGANNGVFQSNTLELEKDYGWTGILIEAAPKNLQKLYKVNRKSWIVPAGLSIKNETMQVEFGDWFNLGQIVDEKLAKQFDKKKSKTISVTCLPLYSILLAMGNPTIDYFSLDVEGYEMDILKTIPFDKVDIKVISVEFKHIKEKGWSVQDLENFMLSQGYIVHSKVVIDYIFVKNE